MEKIEMYFLKDYSCLIFYKYTPSCNSKFKFIQGKQNLIYWSDTRVDREGLFFGVGWGMGSFFVKIDETRPEAVHTKIYIF